MTNIPKPRRRKKTIESNLPNPDAVRDAAVSRGHAPERSVEMSLKFLVEPVFTLEPI